MRFSTKKLIILTCLLIVLFNEKTFSFPFERLPEDVKMHVLLCLPSEDFKKASQVSKSMHKLARKTARHWWFQPKSYHTLTNEEFLGACYPQTLFTKVKLQFVKLTPPQFEAISKNSSIESLYFDSNNNNQQILDSPIDEPIAKALQKGLSQNPHITELVVEANSISLKSMHILRNAFKISSLTVVDFFCCRMSDDTIRVLAESFLKSSMLKKFSLHNNRKTKNSLDTMGMLLKACLSLEELEISLEENTKKTVKYFAKNLKDSSLKKLRLIGTMDKNCSLNSLGAKTLSQALPQCPFFEEISLSDQNIQDNGFEQICNALISCKSLKTLILPFNNLTDNSIDSLEFLLKKNKSLSSIDLSRNKLSDLGIKKLNKIWDPQRGRLIF